MILADTSAWIEYLRATGSATDHLLTAVVETGDLAITDVVVMEVLAGARHEAELVALRQMIAACHHVAVEGPGDYEAAAVLYRSCRAGGATIRRLTDCLIATVAIRADLPVLHRDRDFDAIAAHSALRLA